MADNAQNFGSYVPTTNIWDVSQIYSVDVTSPEFKELLVRLYQNINLIALTLNTKDSGLYTTDEFVNGQIFFPDPALTSLSSTTPIARNVFRTVVNFGALPNATSKNVAHNIQPNDGFTFTRIYGASSDTALMTYIPLPYADAAGVDNIQLDVDATDVIITTASDRTNYTTTYVVLEYLKF